ncbi:hypothetical protein ENUP19_0038G0024 [Entamoeba nuttalli]|uniref:Thioredoxin domain-containing protein n=2 Tax=Entamoeba nuttalli TaxID=412467 RepID=K2GVV8_ENTNP|nr:hypothetical protein ENU1_136160 [Entamoeba nuttalli P19]EKE39253.1 hypothetical protein ENU1_136160 [Entamoeba nuttalli P19]|eukprot:XP_008858410.1 hypothetical protein ENU1_136160 [Entamoeba nuttalli P19]
MLLFVILHIIYSCQGNFISKCSDQDLNELNSQSRHVMIMILHEENKDFIDKYEKFAQKNQDLDVDFKYALKENSQQIIKERDISLYPAFIIIRHHSQKDMILQGGFDLAKLQQFFDISTLPIISYFMDQSRLSIYSNKQYTSSFVFERNKDIIFNPFFNEFISTSYSLAPLTDNKFYYTETGIPQFQLSYLDNMRYSDETEKLVYSAKSNLTIQSWMYRVALPLFQPINEDIKMILKKSDMNAIIIVDNEISKIDYLNFVSIARSIRGHLGLLYCTKGSYYDHQIGGSSRIRVVNSDFKKIDEGVIVEDLIKKHTTNDKIGDLRTFKEIDAETNPLYEVVKMMLNSGQYSQLFDNEHYKPYINIFMQILANKTLSTDVYSLLNQFNNIDFSSDDSDVDEIIDFLKNDKLWNVLDSIQFKDIPQEHLIFISNARRLIHDESASKTLETIVRRAFRSEVVKQFFKNHPDSDSISSNEVFALLEQPEVKVIVDDIKELIKTVDEKRLFEKREL